MGKLKNFLKGHGYIAIELYWIIYGVWFVFLEKTIKEGGTREYFLVHCPLDGVIKFNEYFVIPYVIWYFYLGWIIIYLLIKDRDEFLKMSLNIFGGMTLCLIIYSILPNGQSLRPSTFPRNNIFTDVVKYLYKIDTPTNVCPSIHVMSSIGVHIAVLESKFFKNKPEIKVISWVLVILISISTVFIKQHSVVDGIMAILFSIPLYYLVYKSKFINKVLKKKVNKIFS